MKLYRYLTKSEHADAYIDGGSIPVFPARNYLATERSGIFTPAEILQQSLIYAPIEAINALGKISGDARVRIFGGDVIVGGIRYWIKNISCR